MTSLKVIRGGTVTTPFGFEAAGLYCGIKTKTRKPDLALVLSAKPAVSAATFTKNRLKAWPVLFSMKSIRRSPRHRAILANSGNANCANGPRGDRAVRDTVKTLSQTAGIPEREVLVCSTGLIGVRLPALKIMRALPLLVKKLSARGGHAAARAIMTTDVKAKEFAVSFRLGGREIRLGGIAKGVGMVHPNMATMLNFLTTDCAISRPLLFRALRTAVSKSYNAISIDNDMSTNDTVFILANGLAGHKPITAVNDDYRTFEEALIFVTTEMARMLVKDGEGATKLCELVVSGAKTPREAEKAARTIANSMLFKTMLTGADPNWGRIAAAVGASGIRFRFDQMNIGFDGVRLVSNGKFLIRNRPEVRRILKKDEFRIDVQLNQGHQEARFFTSDLTRGYVDINSCYSS